MIEWLGLSPHFDVAHIGPPLDAGRLPSIFYFALSAEESLALDPYNQPAIFLASKGIRVFSVNLPAHGPGLNALDALGVWAEQFASGHDPLSPFLDQVCTAIEAVFEKGWAIREKIGAMGLSRGGWVALHTMAKSPMIRSAVGFAPLIKLDKTREFEKLQVSLDSSLEIPLPPLVDRPIRSYISNRDIRVGTRTCFDFTESLVETSFQEGVRSPPVDLIIAPPIGHMGHGTSKETFIHGATWLAQQLGEMR